MRGSQKLIIGSVGVAELWRAGRLIARRENENLVPDEYINHMLGVEHDGGTTFGAGYFAPINDGGYTPSVGDTYAVPGFTEFTGYSETNRQAWGHAGVSSKSLTNTGSMATITADGTDTSLHGFALVSLSTKGDVAGGGVIGPIILFDTPLTGILNLDEIKLWLTLTGAEAP